MSDQTRKGTTILEICVAIATLGVLLSVVAIAAPKAPENDTGQRSFRLVLSDARTHAMRDGRTVTVAVANGDSTVRFAVRPSGMVRADGPLPVDTATVTVLWEENANGTR